VILEAAAAGVPTIATEVGACREMLEGQPGEDALLGPSGLIVPVASPLVMAEAIAGLARDPERHARMAEAGLARVERFYRQDAVYDTYRALYHEIGGKPPAPARPARRGGLTRRLDFTGRLGLGVSGAGEEG
jgi:glycosyltransferase involved in cell wall biosynthesis